MVPLHRPCRILREQCQGRMQEFALGGPSPPFPLEVGYLEVGSPLNQLGDLGECCKLPQRGPGQTNSVTLKL